MASIGAALEFSLDFMKSAQVTKAMEEADLFYCEGFFHNTKSAPDSSVLIGKHCAEKCKCFCYNLSAPYLCHIFKQRWQLVFPYIDYLFGSRIDAIAFAEAMEWEESDLPAIMAHLVRMPKVNPYIKRVVVITNGADPTLVATQEGIQEFKAIPIPPEEIVDTNGAGDAFVGGFLSQLVQHRPLDRCVRAGHLAAGEVIRNSGCTFGETPPPM